MKDPAFAGRSPVPGHISTKKLYRWLLVLPLSMLVLAFFYQSPSSLWHGLHLIRLSNDVLLTDYIALSGTGAALLNAALITLINLALLHHFELKPNGIIIAALFLGTGFSFMGKNIFNVWPIYIGGYLYSRYQGISFRQVVVIAIFSTTLSPVTSVLVSAFAHNVPAALIISFSVSCLLGFLMPAISSHVLMAHSGYSLYNIGFAAGLCAIVLYSVLNAMGIVIDSHFLVSPGKDPVLQGFFFLYFSGLALWGYFQNGRSLQGYSELIKRSGRLVTDFTRLDGYPLALFNMGVMGLLALAYVNLMGGIVNGPVIAGILTVAGFSSFGKHPRNTVAIVLGVSLSAQLMHRSIDPSVLIMTALFATTLAPVAGEFGMIYGLLIGFFQLALSVNIGAVHGGISLYNSGLAGGIIATLFVPVINAFRKESPDA